MKKGIVILMIFVLTISIMPVQNVFANDTNYSIRDTFNSNNYQQSLVNKIKEVLNKGENYFREKIKRFSDMGTHWADITVGKLVELGIIAGYDDGTFKPDNTITRSEFAKTVRTSLKLELVEGNSFKDTANHWAKNEIHTLVVNGGIDKNEYGENFEPTKNITRIEMAKMIVRSLGLTEQAKAKAGVKTQFADDKLIPNSDKGYIMIASENKIINGYPDKTFKPYGEATRGEASQIIVNMLDAIEKGLIDIGKNTEGKPSDEEIIKERVEEKLAERKVQNYLPSWITSSAKYENPKTYEELIKNLEELEESKYRTSQSTNYEFVELDQIVSNADEFVMNRPYGVIRMEFPNYKYELKTQEFNGKEYYMLYCDELAKNNFDTGYSINNGEVISINPRIGTYGATIMGIPQPRPYYSIPKDALEKAKYIAFLRQAKYYIPQLDKLGQYVLVVFENPFKK